MIKSKFKIALLGMSVVIFVFVLLLNRSYEPDLHVSEFFPVGEYFPGSNYDHADAIEYVKTRGYWPGTKAIFYTFRGPKTSNFAKISIDGYALKTSNDLFAGIAYHIVSAIKEFFVKRGNGISLEGHEIPVVLGENEKIFRILKNGKDVGQLITVKRGNVVYSYQLFGAQIVGEQPWRVGILSRIKLVPNL